ncbi:MAG: DUF6132 family protein [Bacteroidales bacterium]|nr:DUF6132 family protein [Bacteroidales bacterium]
MKFFKKYLLTRTCLGCLLGVVGGYAYYYFIGCSFGTCPITSNPYASMVYGALLGAVLLYKPKKKSISDANPVNEDTEYKSPK